MNTEITLAASELKEAVPRRLSAGPDPLAWSGSSKTCNRNERPGEEATPPMLSSNCDWGRRDGGMARGKSAVEGSVRKPQAVVSKVG